jgi:hypothetical protein
MLHRPLEGWDAPPSTSIVRPEPPTEMTALDGGAQPGGWVADGSAARPIATADAEAFIRKLPPKMLFIHGVRKLNCSLALTVTM